MTKKHYSPLITDTEKTIGRIWAELLQVEKVDRHANFFEIGGHSLLATQAAFLMSKAFCLEIPIVLIFEQPVLVELAASLETLCFHNSEASDAEEFAEEGEL